MSAASSRARAAILASLLTLTACASIEMELPGDFLQLKVPGLQLKATTPDDARLWVRQFDDYDQGDLSFWVRTLRNDLEQNRGYTPIGEEETVAAGDHEGLLMQFAVEVEGVPEGYLVVVFVTAGGRSNTITVLEFVAEKSVYDERLPAVRAALPTLRF